ncbi:hypothetical protein COCOBI_08-3500 [Coccomyxa sp. Obi]|nr:hypothetical protein COCOBI_08-3500 [Coccomyxa sp. Obi]
MDDPNKGKIAEGEEGLPGKDSSPVQPPRSAPKVESLADSAETLCGLTTSEDDQETAGNQQEGLRSAHEEHMASTASEQSHAATANGEHPETQESEAKQQVASAESHAASDAAITIDSNSEVEALKDVSRNGTQNASADEEVTMPPKYSALRKETTAKAVSSAKHSITRLFAVKSSGAAADSGQNTVVWARMLACFRGAQPLSPRAAPEKVPTDPAQSKVLAGLAHADSMLDQGQWRIGTQTEPEVPVAAMLQLSRGASQQRKGKLPRLLSTAVSIAERFTLVRGASQPGRRSWLPSFASPPKAVAATDEDMHMAPPQSEAPVTESAPSEGQPGPLPSPREASFSRLLVPQLSSDEDLKPKEEVWHKVQHTSVSLAHLLDPPTAVSHAEQPAGAAHDAAKGSAHLRIETRHISPKKSKQRAPATGEDINGWFLPGSDPKHSLSAYLTLRNPALPPTLLDPESPAPWRSRSPTSRTSTPVSSPKKLSTPKKATTTKREVLPGGVVGRGLHLSPHQRQAAATMQGPPANKGPTSPLKPEAAAALARLKQSRLASIAQRRAVSSSPQKSASHGSARTKSWQSHPVDRDGPVAASRKQVFGLEASVMADTLAVLHSHTSSAAHEVGSQKAAGADAARRSLTSPASQRSGSSKAASSKAAAPKAGSKEARHGNGNKKQQGTALERAVLQQYLAARAGRGSYAASSMLRRGRNPAADSSAVREHARTDPSLEGEGETACEGGTPAGDGSVDEQEREWERVHAEIAASLETSSAAHKRSTSSGGQSLPGEHTFAEEQASPAINEGQEPSEGTASGPPSTGESARKVAREIIRWESRNTMGLEHELAALAEAQRDGSSAETFPPDSHGFGAHRGKPAGRPEGALSLELLDQLFERDLAASAVGHSFPPGPMESQCFPKTLPAADAAADATEADSGLSGAAAGLNTAAVETEADCGASGAASQMNSGSSGVEVEMDMGVAAIGTELNRGPSGAGSQVDNGISGGATEMNSGVAGGATEVRGGKAGLTTEVATGIAAVPIKSPTVSAAEKLPFSPSSQLFATVAAKAASPSADIRQVVVPVKLPLDSDLKPQRLSLAFSEAAGSSVALAPPTATAKCAMSGSVASLAVDEAAPGDPLGCEARPPAPEYGQATSAP